MFIATLPRFRTNMLYFFLKVLLFGQLVVLTRQHVVLQVVLPNKNKWSCQDNLSSYQGDRWFYKHNTVVLHKQRVKHFFFTFCNTNTSNRKHHLKLFGCCGALTIFPQRTSNTHPLNPSWPGLLELHQGLGGGADLPYH